MTPRRGSAAPAPAPVPVLEIGGGHATSAAVRPGDWRVLPSSVRRRALDAHDSASALLAALASSGSLLADAAHSGRWGIAVPGPFDYGSGVAWFRGVGKFDALHGVDIGAALRAAVRPPPISLRFLNDADAFVLGEAIAGQLRDRRRAAGITLGTGVGSGFIVDGKLTHDGPGVPPGGRIHELLIDGAPLEHTASRRAIRRAYARAQGDAGADVAVIARRAAASEPAARAALGPPMTALGRLLGPLLEQFGAQRLVAGGAMAQSWELLAPWFAAGWRASGATSIEVLPSRLREHAPLIGAAAWAIRAG